MVVAGSWEVSVLLIVAVIYQSEGQASSGGNFSELLLEQFSLLEFLDISALQQVYSEVYRNPSFGDRVFGVDVVTNLTAQLARDLEEVASAVRALTEEARGEYLAGLNKSCCSEQCVGVSGIDFFRKKCSTFCPEVEPIQTNQTYQGLPELDFYRAQVPTVDNEGPTSVFMDVNLMPDAALGRSVDLNESALHYPADIYDRDPHVLCFAEWSNNLTQFFIANGRSPVTNSVQFQFFAAESGALRFYPAAEWSFLNKCHRCPLKRVDSYDSRFRPWYVNTVYGTKFLIIVMDLSGSMTGFRLLLAKLTAKELLQSLSQNDYFLVLKVGGENESRIPLTNCFSSKTRASPENILTIVEIIDGLSESVDTTGSYEGVVNASLSAFSDVSSGNVICHNLLVFLTDRDVLISDLHTVLNRDRVDTQARIIVVLNEFPTDMRGGSIGGLRNVTCQSGGFVEQIQTYSNIITFMLNFTEVLRSQTVAKSSGSAVFWNHYKDFNEGIVLTCSQPLYIDETFVGVGGIDVNLTSLEHLFQQFDLGPYGYRFLVDNNGQLLLHPLINLTYIDAVSGDDLVTLDVSNFEQVVDSMVFDEVIREAILNRTTGSSSTEVWVAVGGQRSEFRKMNVTYYYAPVDGTPFSLAIVVPDSFVTRSVAVAGGISSSRLNQAQLQFLNSSFANFSQSLSIHLLRPICNVSEFSAAFNTVEFIKVLISQQLGNTGNTTTNCSQLLVDNLLLDLLVLSALIQNETVLSPANENSVLEFPSGLVVWSDGGCGQPPVRLSTRNTVLDYVLHSNISQNYYYNTTCGMSVFRVLEASDVTMDAQFNDTTFSAIYGRFLSSLPLVSSSNSTTLLVLGQGKGLILNSTNSDERGKYFADLYPHVFDAFTSNTAAFSSQVFRGFEVRPCADIFRTTTECSSSSAYSVYKGVLLSVVNALWWVLSGGPLLTMHLAATSLYSSLAAMMSSAQEESSCPVTLCDHKVTTYQWPRPPFSDSGMSPCNNSSTEYNIGAIRDTNLFLIELMGETVKCNDNTTSTDDNLELVLCPCQDRGAMYRVAPPHTHTCAGDNFAQFCSKGSSVWPMKLLVFLVSILSIFISSSDTLAGNFIKFCNSATLSMNPFCNH